MKKTIYSILVVVILSVSISYYIIFKNNIKNNTILYIPTHASYEQVLDSLVKNKTLADIKSFEKIVKQLKYSTNIKSGRYVLEKPMSNIAIVRKLRSGDQDAINITINNIKSIEHLTAKLGEKLEPSSTDFYTKFTDSQLLDSLNLNEDNVLTLFLANTYQFYWNTSAEFFLQKMLKEYQKFWNEKRTAKAKKLGLSITEVIILASIVQKESTKYDEYARIAGVYYNRLKINMKLQADPTVLYAKQSLGLANRVYNKDTKIEHPYNTYFIDGLPPGPICLPETKSIDLTLDLENHNYIYFCAKEDFSGYHNFAADWKTHEANAKKFHQAMNEKNIK